MIQQPNIAQQPQVPQPNGANAVSINIYNPQAYGSAPQTPPYNYTNSLYQMPQAQLYPQATQQPVDPLAYQQFMQTQTPAVQPVIAPAPQLMPDSVINTPAQAEQVPSAAQETKVNEAKTEEPKAEQTTSSAQTNAQEPVQVVENNTNAIPTVDVDTLVKNLKSDDIDVKAQTINDIATYAQEKPEVALQVVHEPVMQGLVDIIKEDTSGLEGPTDKQIEIAEKISKGEQLTPEEDAISEQLSPRDKVNKNRIFALYTLAMLQKLQRDELNQYAETQKANGEKPIETPKLQELIGYDAVQDIIKNDSRPEVKVAAIQALQHVAQPEDKETVETVLADSLKSTDEQVKLAAQEAVAKFQQA